MHRKLHQSACCCACCLWDTALCFLGLLPALWLFLHPRMFGHILSRPLDFPDLSHPGFLFSQIAHICFLPPHLSLLAAYKLRRVTFLFPLLFSCPPRPTFPRCLGAKNLSQTSITVMYLDLPAQVRAVRSCDRASAATLRWESIRERWRTKKNRGTQSPFLPTSHLDTKRSSFAAFSLTYLCSPAVRKHLWLSGSSPRSH